MGFDFDPNRPIYLQIVEEIKKRAVRGIYGAGEQLPSVREMARAMSVNANTMARAYMELERAGFTYSRRGQGSFITDDPKRLANERQQLANAASRRFIEEIKDLALDNAQITNLLKPMLEEFNRD